MRRLGCGFMMVLLLGLVASPAVAQRLAGSVHVGTLGIGAQVATPLGNRINLRGGFDFQPVSFNVPVEDVELDVELPSATVTAVFDLYPSERGFRLSAGVLYFGGSIGLEGAPTEDVEFGNSVYTTGQVGTIRGSLGTSRFAPYLGLGWGNAIGAGLGFALDVGIAYHGTPEFSLEATGPASSDPQFRMDLDAEAESVNEDIPGVASMYPILKLGLSYGF